MEWLGNEVVLGVPLGDRTVGVVRTHAGHLLFPGRVDSGGGVVLERWTPQGTTVDDRTVVAGRRLPGVARVVVIDDAGAEHEATVGEEVWVAVASEAGFAEPLARFEDAAGALVALPLPAGDRRAVTDAEAPCPICGSLAWIEIGTRVHCERCGLRVGAGMHFVRFGAVASDAVEDVVEVDGDEEEDDWGSDLEREQAQALARAAFPIYGLLGREPQISGYSSGEDGVESVSVHYAEGDRSVEIETHVRDHWRPDRLRESLASMITRSPHRDGSDAALRVHHTDAQRTARRRAARAERQTRAFVVDGQPEPFTFVAVEQTWLAVREHYGVTIHVSSRGIDPSAIVLEPLSGLGSGSSSAERARRAAAGALLTREEVAALIDEHDLGEHREKILAAIRPAYRLVPDTHSPHRIGGLPDLAPGERWPHDEDGIPYTFVAQIDCSQLPPVVSEFDGPPWNHGGALLRIFAALDGRAPEGGPAVALACPPDAPLTRTEVPPRPDPMPADVFEPDDDSLRRLEEVPVRLQPFLTARQGWYVLGARADQLRYDDFAYALEAGGAKPRRDAWQDAQLLGHASNEQGEDPIHAGTWLDEDTVDEDWCTLLNLPAHPGMSFGDGGSLAVVIRVEDLAAGRYDRMATDQSMG
jgi:hypothetical protein